MVETGVDRVKRRAAGLILSVSEGEASLRSVLAANCTADSKVGIEYEVERRNVVETGRL